MTNISAGLYGRFLHFGRLVLSHLAYAALTVSFITGCSGPVERAVSQSDDLALAAAPPQWVLSLPNRPGYVCAVGASGPTYYRDEARITAAEGVRKELAASINTIISTRTRTRQNEDGFVSSVSVSEISEFASEAILNNSKIEAYWYDTHGVAPSSPGKGYTYAYGCIEEGSF